MALPILWIRVSEALGVVRGALQHPAQDGSVGWWLMRVYDAVEDPEQYAIDGLDQDDFGGSSTLFDILDDARAFSIELVGELQAAVGV